MAKVGVGKRTEAGYEEPTAVKRMCISSSDPFPMRTISSFTP